MPFGLLLALTLAAQPANLVRNASFEEVDAHGAPLDWSWQTGATHGTFTVDETVHRSGRRALKIANPTGFAPHVYCHFEQWLDLKPNRQYTLSAYVRGPAPRGWIGGGPEWLARVQLPTGDDWQRVSLTFETGAEARWQLLLSSDDRTAGFWLDDLQVEEGAVATDFHAPIPLQPGELRVTLEPSDGKVNLLPNPSFEKLAGGLPEGWIWDPRNTDATCTVVPRGRLGGNCLKLTNGTAFSPHVYGQLRLGDNLTVRPNTAYTLSYYTLTDGDPGIAWAGGGDGWWVRLKAPETHGVWRRVIQTFTTKPTETSIPFMIITESPTQGVLFDDLMLQAGPKATAFEAPGLDLPASLSLSPTPGLLPTSALVPAWKPDVYPPTDWLFTSGAAAFEGGLRLRDALPGGALEVTVLSGAEKLATARVAPDGGMPRWAEVTVEFGLPARPLDKLAVEARVVGPAGEVLRGEPCATRLVTGANVLAELARAEAQLPALAERAKRDDDARVVATVLRHFAQWTRDDLGQRQVARAYDTAVQLDRLAREQLAKKARPPAPRYVTSPLKIAGAAFVGTVRKADGSRAQQPVYFLGYGAFGSVRRDVEELPGYGLNMIQIEFGPNSVFPADGQVSPGAIDEFLNVADRAAKSGVQVNLLLSPHYFPQWAYEKWPVIGGFDGGFLRYSVYSPEARGVEEQFLRTVIPRIKDHPALHSICLSNEPLSIDLTHSREVPALWHDWLKQQFGTLEAVNRRWGQQFASFDDIPVLPPKFEATAMCYDFSRFNQDIFAGWHRWMADVIHSMAPSLPVHAKIMMSAHFWAAPHGIWSIAPELFSDLSQINGNDCCKWPGSGSRWACEWLGENMGYDYQRSALDAPVFNSENHLIVDRDVHDVTRAFIRNVYWQGAIHGQGAETTWVWERTDESNSDFTGSIMHRPECAAEHGLAALDLNRAGPEVAAIAGAPAPVAVLWSQASAIWNPGQHQQLVRDVYLAANFLDVNVGFVNEHDAERYGKGQPDRAFGQAKVVLVPGASHVPPATLAALRKFTAGGGKVIRVGECLTHDDAGQPLDAAGLGESWERPERGDVGEQLSARLRGVLAAAGVKPLVGIGVFGVEARSA
ncbi:MAG: beta-galactosidase, partial [Armatimonadetes bacterium]|nr:beta-galactosidase [Armatimonadota bacterium]